MVKKITKRASLSDLEDMKKKGKLFHNPDAAVSEELRTDFWDDAVITEPQGKTSVHLRIDSDIYAFFKKQGKGHLTRMNAVLRSYVEAHQSK